MGNLALNLTEAKDMYPHRAAVRLDDLVVTYQELEERSARVAGLLAARGVRPGDRVGLMLPNVAEFPVLYYGVLRAGGVVVPMNPLLKAREVEYYLGDSGAGLLFAWHTTAEEAAKGAEAAGTSCIAVGAAELDRLLGEHAAVTAVTGRADDDTAVILYTSGTTGRPKGAELTHASLARNAAVSAATLFHLEPDDVVMGCLPLFHSFGQTCGLNAAVASGACLTLLPRFDPGRALEVIGRDRVTVFEGVPTMYVALLNQPRRGDHDTGSLRVCVSGGAALPVEALRGFEDAFGCIILEGYGLSETSPVASFNHPDRDRKAGSIGTPIEGVQLRLVDPLGEDVPTGEVGEIAIRGHNLMKGYWRQPQATRQAIPDGWLRTGDLARQDADGYFLIVDRKKDLIIRGGYNVYPREVEEVLYEHPAVAEAAVIGLPHPTHGEEVGAAVVLKPGAEATPAELRAFCKQRVAAYKYPRHVWLQAALPKTATGKLLRRRVQPPRGAVAMTAQPETAAASATAAADAAAALDLLLAAAALGPQHRLLPGMAGVRFAAGLARRPDALARQAAALAAELARIGLGSSTLAPSPRDRRFSDPAWTSNPLLRRLVKAYLAAGRTAEQLLDGANLDWRDAQRIGFVADNLMQALAPSNNPATSPAFWKALADSHGGSLVRGARHLAADLATPPRVPSMVEPDAFEVGVDLAVTPGAVVLRTPVFELLQYQPQTPTVRQIPLLIVPPTINKYYILDLAPDRSLVEYLVRDGQQVFVISWRNPDARHRAWDADTYGQAILQALAATRRICRTDRSLLLGLCSGGMLAAMVLAHLAATGQQERVAGFGLAVTVLDQARAGMASAMLDEHTAKAAIAASAARGFLDGRALAEVFAWLRPGELIWTYWGNNYLQGRTPPAFDILAWNADTTRMPAGLHRDFIRLAVDNTLTRPGAASMLGTPVDLAKIDADAYLVAGIADHLCPWQSCYRTTQLLGGRSRFVLSSNGHIASIVNPPGNPKATVQTAATTPADPADWLDQATTQRGSWWPDYVGWLAEHGGGDKPRPRRLGAAGFRPIDPAPGTYALDR